MSFDYSTSQKTKSNLNSDSNQSKFEFSGSSSEEIVSLFRPEIESFDLNFIQTFPSLFEQTKNFFENGKSDKNIFVNFRKNFQNENPIAQSIINDNVENFHSILSNLGIENIDSIEINHSIFERIDFLNDKRNPPKILEFAAFCGSVKIFKFLLLDLRGSSSASSLPPLHFYQQQQFQQREQLIKQQMEQLYNLQNKQGNNQIGLVQMQQQMHIQKQQEQLLRFQAQYQQKFQQQQNQFQQQQQKQILNKLPSRLHLFACAGGNAEIIHIIEQEGFFSDDKKMKEAIEISIQFHQNKIFDYLFEKSNLKPTIEMMIICVKSCNYYCFISLFDQYHTEIVGEINKKGKNGENILHIACALGRLPFVQFLTSIDYELEKKLCEKNENLNINIRDSNGFSALHLAAAGGHIEIIKYLVSCYNKEVKHVQENNQEEIKQNLSFPKLNSLNNSPSPRPKLVANITSPKNSLNQSIFKSLDQENKSIILNSSSLTTNNSSLNSSSLTTDNSSLNSSSINSVNSFTNNLISNSNSTTANSILSPIPPNENSLSNSASLNSTSPSSNLISNSKSAPSSPKLVTLPNSNLLSSKSTSIRRKINANSVSFSKTVSLGNLSFSQQQTGNTNHLNLNVKDFKGRTAAQVGYENGFSDVSKFLISQKEYEINSRDDSGIALIHLASMNNDLDFLVYMTNEAKSRIDLNVETKKNRQTAFLIAASNGNLEMASYLIGLSTVNKKCRDIQGQMAHHIACSANKKEKTKNKTEDKNIEEKRNGYISKYTIYYLTKTIKQNNINHEKFSKTKDTNESNSTENIDNNENENIDNNKNSENENIDNNKNNKRIENNETSENENIDNNKNSESIDNKDDENNVNEIIENNCNDDEFYQCSNLEVLRFLVGNQGFNVNDKDGSQQTPLHHACIIGDFEIVKFLTSVVGIDINARDKEGRTPLVLAFINDNLLLAKFLIEETSASIKIADNDGRNALHLSAQGGHYDNIIYIFSLQDKIKQHNHDKTARNRNRSFKLSFENENENESDNENEAIESSQELDINGADNFGRTCLHLSFESGNTELIKFILNRKDIDLNARDKGGRTLLHFAASFNYMFVIKFLESQGPIPRKCSYGYSGYGYGYGRTSYSTSNKFDMKNVNAKANHDWTALHFAAAGGFVEMCEFLVSVKYVNSNARDSTGMTPLHLAVQHEKIDTVRFLSNVPDVYVNSQDNEGRTPLHLACSMGEIDIIKLLVKCKEIDLTKLDKKSQTAFKHLTVENQKSLAYLFK